MRQPTRRPRHRAFGPATPMMGINLVDDDDPALTADRLEIFSNSGRTGSVGAKDLWTATRSDPDAAWTTPTHVTSLDTTVDASPPRHLARRVDALLRARADRSAGPRDIPAPVAKDRYVAARTTRTSPWSTSVHVAFASLPRTTSDRR